MPRRDYERIAALVPCRGERQLRMQGVVDGLWDALSGEGVSWVGFYLPAGENELVLGPRRDKPACSPIGLHGVCGRAYLSRQPQVVYDVRDLGANYVACDPRDRSEVVVPLLEPGELCSGVLDLDSYDVGAFGADDVTGLERVLRAAGLTT